MRWLTLATPALAWGTQLVVGSQTEELACRSGVTAHSDTRLTLVLISAAAIVAIAVAGIAGERELRTAGDADGGSARMIAAATLFSAVLFGALVIFGAIEILVLAPCSAA